MTGRAEDITLGIIAGGAGTRMGMPKHGLKIDGEAILVGLLGRMRWEGPTVLVVGADRPVVAGAEGCDRVVCDEVADQGPLRGVLTVLEAAETDAVVAVPIDMPELGREHVDWVRGLGEVHREALGIMLRDGGGRVQPFPLLCRRGLAPLIKELLGSGRRSLGALAEVSRARVEDAPKAWPALVWTNLNTPREMVEYISALRAAEDGPHS